MVSTRSFRTYASVTRGHPSEAPSSPPGERPTRSVSLPLVSRVSLDELDFPELGEGGGTSPLRRTRHWRTRQVEREVGDGRPQLSSGSLDDHRRPSSTEPQPQTTESSLVNSSFATPAPTPASPWLDPSVAPSLSPRAPPPFAPAPAAPPPLPHVDEPALRPTSPASTRAPLNESERAHILSVLDVSREALRRLEHRDRARDQRVTHLRQQIDAMESLLRGGSGSRRGQERELSGLGETDGLEETGESSMLPHSLLTGQVSLLRRRGAIHRPNHPLNSFTAPPNPTAPPSSDRPISFSPRPSQSLMDLLAPTHVSSPTLSSLRSMASHIRAPGSSRRAQDDDTLPARLRSSHIQLLSQQFAAAGAARQASPPSTSGLHRPTPGKPGWSNQPSNDQRGSWRLWCKPSAQKRTKQPSVEERCLVVGPPTKMEASRTSIATDGGCGALVVLHGAAQLQGRFVMSEIPVGLGQWDDRGDEDVREVEKEMGMGQIGCACVKRPVACLNCGRILGTYLDPSAPYHTHPLYTLSAKRVSSMLVQLSLAEPDPSYLVTSDSLAAPAPPRSARAPSIFSSTAFTLPPRTTRPPLRNRPQPPPMTSDSDSEDSITLDNLTLIPIERDAAATTLSDESAYVGPRLARRVPPLGSLSYDEERLASMRERSLASLEHLSRRLGTAQATSTTTAQPSLSLTARVEDMLRTSASEADRREATLLDRARREREPSPNDEREVDSSTSSDDATVLPSLVRPTGRTGRPSRGTPSAINERSASALLGLGLAASEMRGERRARIEERRDLLDLETLRGIRRRILAAGGTGESKVEAGRRMVGR